MNERFQGLNDNPAVWGDFVDDDNLDIGEVIFEIFGASVIFGTLYFLAVVCYCW